MLQIAVFRNLKSSSSLVSSPFVNFKCDPLCTSVTSDPLHQRDGCGKVGHRRMLRWFQTFPDVGSRCLKFDSLSEMRSAGLSQDCPKTLPLLEMDGQTTLTSWLKSCVMSWIRPCLKCCPQDCRWLTTLISTSYESSCSLAAPNWIVILLQTCGKISSTKIFISTFLFISRRLLLLLKTMGIGDPWAEGLNMGLDHSWGSGMSSLVALWADSLHIGLKFGLQTLYIRFDVALRGNG